MKKILNLGILTIMFMLVNNNFDKCGISFSFDEYSSNLQLSPTDSTQCAVDSTNDLACCYVSLINAFQICAFIPMNMTFIAPMAKSANYTGGYYKMKINCSFNYINSSPLICGKSDPTSISDCSQYNVETNRCCYYHSLDSSNNYTFCLWGGLTDIQEVGIDMNLFNFVGECQSSKFIGTNLLFFVLLFYLIIL